MQLGCVVFKKVGCIIYPSMSNKKYGLILPGAAKAAAAPAFQASRNVFGDDSDSENESKKKPVLLRPSQNVNRQAKIEQEKAIQEDPTVYQYDEIYDSMATKKEQTKSKSKEEKKPKYIENLLKTATKRKIENERRIERQIQKEREKEGDEFADKEVFVTSAYKKKLEEMKLEEEKERREEYLESIGDVTKQRDLGGFYRHLYEQKLGPDIPTEESKKEKLDSEKTKESDGSTTPERPQPEVFKKKHSEEIDSSKKKSESSKKRNYRKRKTSSDVHKILSEGEIDESDDEINRMNLTDISEAKRIKKTDENIDADSDFSVNDPSEDESTPEPVSKKIDSKSTSEEISKSVDESQETHKKDRKVRKEEEDRKEEAKENTPEPPPKPKIDIWKKRTVGEVFDQALKRYYERKATRGF